MSEVSLKVNETASGAVSAIKRNVVQQFATEGRPLGVCTERLIVQSAPGGHLPPQMKLPCLLGKGACSQY